MNSKIMPIPHAGRVARLKDLFFFLFPLVFSIYYFVPVVVIPITGITLIWAIVYYVIFLGLYAYSISRKRPVFWPALVIISLAAIASHTNPGAHNFFMYACFLAGFTLHWTRFLMVLGGIILLALFLERLYNYEFIYYTLYVLIGCPPMGIMGLFIRARSDAECREKRSREEIALLAKAVERERIARDLHDVIGHTLSTITLKAELAHKLLARDESAKSLVELEQLLDVARGGLKQVRDTISGVQRATLAEELAQLVDKLRQRGLKVIVTGSPPALPVATENALGLILTELTTNILRHSNADSCEFTWVSEAHRLILRVCDNGSVKRLQTGNGLLGISRRMEDLGGTVDINTNQGFCVSLALTLETS